MEWQQFSVFFVPKNEPFRQQCEPPTSKNWWDDFFKGKTRFFFGKYWKDGKNILPRENIKWRRKSCNICELWNQWIFLPGWQFNLQNYSRWFKTSFRTLRWCWRHLYSQRQIYQRKSWICFCSVSSKKLGVVLGKKLSVISGRKTKKHVNSFCLIFVSKEWKDTIQTQENLNFR